MFAVTVRGTMLTNQAAHRVMKTSGTGGSIVIFASEGSKFITGQRIPDDARVMLEELITDTGR